MQHALLVLAGAWSELHQQQVAVLWAVAAFEAQAQAAEAHAVEECSAELKPVGACKGEGPVWQGPAGACTGAGCGAVEHVAGLDFAEGRGAEAGTAV